MRGSSEMSRVKFLAAAACATAALAMPAGATADQVGGGPSEPAYSGFGNGGQSNGATVCHNHNPGVGVNNRNGSHGTGFCGE